MSVTKTSCLQITELSIDDLRSMCRDEKLLLFAILDACDEPLVPEKVQALGNERAACLYRGAAERDYWSIAPYLVEVDEPLFDWIVDNLWKEPWGIFAVADSTLKDIRKHFRKFLLVEGPDGEELYFRFYDPRVIRSYINSCDPGEARQFFGPCQSIVTFDETIAGVVQLRLGE